ncbi:MAG: 4-hydroxythreonine-4-phosphate dehydrogenase PdxA [Pseudomonadota bacterium]
MPADSRRDHPPRPIAVSMGEPGGIGPELAVMAWLRRTKEHIPPFLVFGSSALLAARCRGLGWGVPIATVTSGDTSRAMACFANALPVVSVLGGDIQEDQPGRPTPKTAQLVVQAIEAAVTATVSGTTRAVVTAPIQKDVLYTAGFGFPGHTEFLADLAQRQTGAPVTPVMMIASDMLKTVPVTIHIPLSKVPAALTIDAILTVLKITDRDLRARFGIKAPRLVVAGLNPHAGEAGTIGTEDRDIIAPAVEHARANGLDVRGPLPADTLFHDRARVGFDAAIAMYHDQALIPVKALAFDEAVNVTLGLPFVRTSPDHGTAIDIAGMGTANPSSFIAALKLADRMTQTADAT